ncbi:MAG: ATP-binding protein [Caldilineaceae bacterium]
MVVRLSVWDTGIGIAHQDFARLFKPFVQLDSSLAREYAGSGLGLVLVYRMAEMHGGGVTVESEVGQGSRFTVSLPWRTPTTGAVSVMPLPDDADFGQPQRNAPAASLPLVLIADDQELVTTSLVPMLTSAGVRTVVAQNGLDAIEKARTLRPALLLIDMQLPPMESKEILTALRNEVELATTPIIAISALNWPGQTEQYLADGATAHLCKPVGVKQLRDLLQAWLPR